MDPITAMTLATMGIRIVRDITSTARINTTDPTTRRILDGILARVEGARELAEQALDAADKRDEATLARIAAAEAAATDPDPGVPKE